MDSLTVLLTYTNHRGETRERRVWPHRLFWGSTPWHPEPQWLLLVFDFDKREYRDFAMRNVTGWRAAPDEGGQ